MIDLDDLGLCLELHADLRRWAEDIWELREHEGESKE